MLHNKIHKTKGFTMIELLVVLLIIGILAAVAAPMYLAHTEKAKASEAVGVLSLIRSAEREFYTVHRVYPTVSAANMANDPGAATPGLGVNVSVAQYFSQECFSVNNATATFADNNATANFLITANGLSSVAFDGTTGARNNGDVSTYRVQMDNTGRIIYSTDNGATWKSYNG